MIDLPDAPELPGIDSAAPTAAINDVGVRTLDEDGTVHFSHLKKLALSGVQYLHAVNTTIEPTRAMLIGTAVHQMILGPRPGAKRLARFDGATRRGKEWEAFKLANHDAEIISATEWAEAEAIAASVRLSPIARRRLEGARFEVPLRWEESGIPCSTSGVDIIPVGGGLGDLKATFSTHPETFKRHAFRMLYPMQLAFYRRGARANGIDVSEMFILGVESKAPYEVVELRLTPDLADMADRTISLWIEDLRRNMLAIPTPETIYDWPGYAQAPVEWDVPPWERGGELDEDENEDGEEAAA